MKIDDRLLFPRGTINAESKEELIRLLSEKLWECGYVEKDFSESVLCREKRYPTGLKLHGTTFHIAIPHAEPEYVKEDAVAAVVLSEPVPFCRMDDPEEEVSVSFVVMLAIRDAEDHMKMLSGLVQALQNPERVEELSCAAEEKELAKFIKSIQGGSVNVSE